MVQSAPQIAGRFFMVDEVDVVDNVDTVDDELTGSHRGLSLQPRHARPLSRKTLHGDDFNRILF